MCIRDRDVLTLDRIFNSVVYIERSGRRRGKSSTRISGPRSRGASPPTELVCTSCIGHVTFAEFAEYVVDEWKSGRRLDRHWRPQHEICNPCYVQYDFIGRFEQLSDDTSHVLAKLTSFHSPGSRTDPISSSSWPN